MFEAEGFAEAQIQTKIKEAELKVCLPASRRPFGSWARRRNQELQVIRVRAVGGSQTSEGPDGVLHRWARGGSQGLVPLQPQTLQTEQVRVQRSITAAQT